MDHWSQWKPETIKLLEENQYRVAIPYLVLFSFIQPSITCRYTAYYSSVPLHEKATLSPTPSIQPAPTESLPQGVSGQSQSSKKQKFARRSR